MKKQETGLIKVPEKKEKKVAPKKEKRIRPHWNALVKVYFDFCLDKFGEKPSFAGGDPRYMGDVVDTIEKKAIDKNLEWTEDVALRSFKMFLDYCFADRWLSQNFLLMNLSRQKDKIFFKIKGDLQNGKSNPTKEPQHIGSNKTAGQNIFADRLRERIEKLQ